MAQLRAEKQGEWNARVVAELREELRAEKGLIRTMISLEQYKADLDHAKAHAQALLVGCLCALPPPPPYPFPPSPPPKKSPLTSVPVASPVRVSSGYREQAGPLSCRAL
jgi:hypothetical protein